MYVTSIGMVCPVGLTAASACAALRAGISGFADLEYDSEEELPVIGAAVPGLDRRLGRVPRLVELLARALAECLAGSPGLRTEQVPLLAGLAEPDRPGGPAGRAAAIIPEVETRLGRKFHRRLSEPLARGHTAVFASFQRARELLLRGDIPACLVAGVDSYLNAISLDWLHQAQRLKTEGNSNGVIPGEAAAAVLLQRRPPAPPMAPVAVLGLGFAVEKVHVLSEEPFLGLGLAEAARAALAEARLGLHEIHFRLSDVTGESYGFKEQALLLPRVMRERVAEFPIWHCADSIGDVGAAVGACLLVHAFQAFSKGYAPGDRAVGCTSSVPGERAVAIFQRQTA
jgi:3-oxoacyl-[acyl-carrier-protein] synthase-1